MGIRPEAWGAAHTLDSGSPACAQSLHIDVYMPPPPPPLSIYFVCLFFFLGRDRIHIEYNIFVYLTGREKGAIAAELAPPPGTQPAGTLGRDLRPLPSPSAQYCGEETRTSCLRVYFKMCLCVCLTFY